MGNKHRAELWMVLPLILDAIPYSTVAHDGPTIGNFFCDVRGHLLHVMALLIFYGLNPFEFLQGAPFGTVRLVSIGYTIGSFGLLPKSKHHGIDFSQFFRQLMFTQREPSGGT